MKKLIMFALLLVILIPASYAATEEVEVDIPEFDVTINGNIIDNKTEAFPFIQYKGITYMPMTWDLSYSLGLELKWSDVEGLKVNKREKMQVYVQKEKVVNNMWATFKATVVNFPVFVNGKEVDKLNNDYPLLNFRNVTYFPMTYDYMVTEFNSGYEWNDDTGLMVSADPSLEIFIPEPYYVSLKVTAEEMAEKGLMYNEMLYFEREEGNDNDYIKVYTNMNHNYDGYYYNVKVTYYDDQDKILYINPITSGEIYQSTDRKSYADVTYGIFRKGAMNEAYFVIDLEFLPIPIARADFIKNYSDISYEYFDEETIDLDYLKSQNAAYIGGYYLKGNKGLIPDDLLPYAAVLSSVGVLKEGSDIKYNIFRFENGTVEFSEIKKNYVQLSKLTKLFIKTDEVNGGLKCYSGNLLEEELNKGVIKLYDSNKKLFKVLLNKSEIEKARNRY